MITKSVKFSTRLKKVRVGRIRYINVVPVYYGIEQGLKPSYMKLVNETPAALNRMMERGEIDISPVSSAAYARNYKDWDLLPGLSISSFGNVMSVILASNLPIEELDNRKILLSDESASAVEMLKLVLSWKNISPVYETGSIKEKDVTTYQDHDAVLVIGNSALTGKWNRRFKYIWDLGSIWQHMTGLPFVFAVWAVRKSFSAKQPEIVAEVADLLMKSKQQGSLNLEYIQKSTSRLLGIDIDTCRTYFKRLNYDLERIQIQGLTSFYRGLCRQGIISEPVKISFIPSSPELKTAPEPRELLYSRYSRIPALLTNMQKQAYLSLRSLHFPLPLKKVFPQLYHLLRQDRR
jgi:chorismate dehydratase